MIVAALLIAAIIVPRAFAQTGEAVYVSDGSPSGSFILTSQTASVADDLHLTRAGDLISFTVTVLTLDAPDPTTDVTANFYSTDPTNSTLPPNGFLGSVVFPVPTNNFATTTVDLSAAITVPQDIWMELVFDPAIPTSGWALTDDPPTTGSTSADLWTPGFGTVSGFGNTIVTIRLGLPDADEDGVLDDDDDCPLTYNPNQLDTDGDGNGDACDLCAGSDDTLDADGDGVPDGCDTCPGSDDTLDADGDGVPDGCDNCPSHANPDQADGDNDGFGDVCEETLFLPASDSQHGDAQFADGSSAGLYTFTLAGESELAAFCAEGGIAVGENANYAVVPIEAIPDAMPMGIFRADQVREVWAENFSIALTATEASALQLALWELIYDGDMDVTTGAFAPPQDDPAVPPLANSMLASVDGIGPRANLEGLTLGGAQDLIYEVNNAPPVITCTSPVVVWPPNHDLVDVSGVFTVSDLDGDDVTITVRVFSDETEAPACGPDGLFAPDYKNELYEDGRGLLVRAERRIFSNGRFYIGVITADDGRGGVTTEVCTLAVVPVLPFNFFINHVLCQAENARSQINPSILPPPGLAEHGLSDEMGPLQ